MDSLDTDAFDSYEAGLANLRTLKSNFPPYVHGLGFSKSAVIDYLTATENRFRHLSTPMVDPRKYPGQFPPGDPNTDSQIANFFVNLQSHQNEVADLMIEIAKINSIITYWTARSQFIVTTLGTLSHWIAWNTSVLTYFTTGIVRIVGPKLSSLEFSSGDSDLNNELGYDSDSKDLNIKSNNFRDYFAILQSKDFFGIDCTIEAAEECDIVKNSRCMIAKSEIDSIVGDSAANISSGIKTVTGLFTESTEVTSVITSAITTRSNLEVWATPTIY